MLTTTFTNWEGDEHEADLIGPAEFQAARNIGHLDEAHNKPTDAEGRKIYTLLFMDDKGYTSVKYVAPWEIVSPAVIKLTGRTETVWNPNVGDYVTDEIANHLHEVLPPIGGMRNGKFQVSEAMDDYGKDYRARYTTYVRAENGQWVYCGNRMKGDWPKLAPITP